MGFIRKLNKELEGWFLLEHTFYKAWSNGKLTRESLKLYAREYYHHVAAFPRYLSQIHTLCENIKNRQVLLDNLIEEEKGDENHPELWLRFLEGVSGSRNTQDEPTLPETKDLVDGFFKLTRQGYAIGLGALYAYERQTPAVSNSKIKGLKKHYNVTDSRTLKFFHVHEEADEWHTAELISLISNMNAKDQECVRKGAVEGAKLLWKFLDGINIVYESSTYKNT